MNLWKKTLLTLMFIVLVSFGFVGYAKFTDTLTIYGNVSSDIQENVFIVDVQSLGDENATINAFTSTILNSKVSLSSSSNSTASFEIKLYNNSNTTYAFNLTKYTKGEGTYDNENIIFSLSGLERRQEINGGDYLTFTITFSYDNKNNITNNILNSVLKFEFLLPELIEEDDSSAAISGALGQFKKILDDTDDFEELIGQMDSYSTNDRYDSSYIGNVSGASDSDITAINNLFENNLTINIDGVETNVKFIIKRENIDGNGNTGDKDGCEMTIYMTTSELTSRYPRPTIYAGVYTKSEGSDKWEVIGDMFIGNATVKGYDGNIFGTGSFDTDSWRSTNANGQISNRTIGQMIDLYI